MNCPLNGDCLRYFVPWRTFNMIVMKIAVPVVSAFITASVVYAWNEWSDRTVLKSDISEIHHKQAFIDSVVIKKLTRQSKQYAEISGKLDKLLDK